MVELLIVVVMGLLVISAAATFGPRLGFAAPLLLVVVGIGVSLLPFAPEVHVEPEWILSGVLPPLLYSAAVSMPSMNFRREFTAIGGLSFVLVVVSSLVVGVVFAWLVPGLGLVWGIALGAIVSPTDAVATSIVKRAGAPTRVVTIPVCAAPAIRFPELAHGRADPRRRRVSDHGPGALRHRRRRRYG
ncbi:MAG TPA: cation:proton antiporter [Rubrobacter sp.]|nr:cation:proton antiporter [Rubrobacter sp.]